MSSSRALVAVRLVAAIWKSCGSAKPSGALRPTLATGRPLNAAFNISLWRAVEGGVAVRHEPFDDDAGQHAERQLMFDGGDEIGLERRIVAELQGRDSYRP